MRLILAPMEGLADQSLRDILTRLGGIDLCVAEFVRVTNHLLTENVLLRAVPKHIPITAKMRLGLEDTSLALDCARAIEAGGADEITVHARTRSDRYRPPARWEWLAHIRETVKLPVVATERYGRRRIVKKYAMSAAAPT